MMPDISMCRNMTCPSKDKCHRFTAKPSSFWQSYMKYDWDKKTKKCDSFWDNKDY
jgi:hypothetical protein